MIVNEEINFTRTRDSKKSLGVGLQNNPWVLYNHLLKVFKEKGYYIRESLKDFEENKFYTVIFNIGISKNDNINQELGLFFLHFKPGRSITKYGVDHPREDTDKNPILFNNNDWEECINYIDQNIEKWS